MSLNNEKSTRKEYHSPRLVAFGDIRQLTQATTNPALRRDNPNIDIFKTQGT